MNVFSFRYWFDRLQRGNGFPLLFLWIIIGCLLRLTQLTAKPLWTDEFATLVFSLGNDYQSIPLNQVIPIEVLLQPLHPNSDAGIPEVVSHLLNEDNHPPLYFVLAHWWLKLFPHPGNYISLWAARSLPAFLGVLSIPALYFLGQLTFRSCLVAQLAAAMMAVSPYGIYLAQEARHYTLAILCVIASLACLIVATRYIWEDICLPIWLVFLWILINSLGIAVHYFFSLTLCAEAMTLILLGLSHSLYIRGYSKKYNFSLPFCLLPSALCLKFYAQNLVRLGIVAAGTISTGLVWILVVLPRGYGNGMTAWIRPDHNNLLSFFSPLFQIFATWITMLSLLPVESSSLLIMIVSGLIMLLFFLWVIPIFKRGFTKSWQNPEYRLPISILVGFISSAIAIFFSITYFLKIDITRGARYSFVYFPAVILLLGAILASCWIEGGRRQEAGGRRQEAGGRRQRAEVKKLFSKRLLIWLPRKGKIAVIIIWLMGLLSAITVASNLGYQKYYRPDLLVSIIEQKSSAPILIATTHNNLVQTGELMGIAWQLKQNRLRSKTAFVLVHQESKDDPITTVTLEKILTELPRPLDLWLINFQVSVDLKKFEFKQLTSSSVDGYTYQAYHLIDRVLTSDF